MPSVRRESRIASAAARRSPETRVRSEASIATSVPVPIARPRSAWASAGASLTPSPTIATTRPSRLQARDDVGLVGGQDLGDDLGRSRPRPPTGSAVVSVVAGQQDRAAGRARAGGRSPRRELGLTVSATTRTALRLAVPAGGDRGPALALGAASSARSKLVGRSRGRQSSSSAGRPATTSAAFDHALDAEALVVAEVLDARAARRPARWPRSAIARAIGCSEAFSSAPTSRSASASSTPSATDDLDCSVISPVVTVPVLSSTIVSTCARRLEDLGALDQQAELGAAAGADQQRRRCREPERAGAGDDQHRDGGGERVGGADVGAEPEPERRDGERDHDRARRSPEIRSASRCTGALPVCASVTRRAIWASAVSAPTLVARTTRRPPALTVAPGDLVARADLDRHRLARQQRLVDRRAALDRPRRRSRPSRPGGRRTAGRPRARRRDRGARLPSSSSTETSLAPSSSSASSAAPARRLARASK